MRSLLVVSVTCAFLKHATSQDNILDNVTNLGDDTISQRRDKNFTELVAYDGYNSETYTVTTDDGYILSVFRIPVNKSCKDSSNLEPIIFMHGLYLSGDDCIIPGPGKAHCYIYSDACYDVWVPNNRGNRYSRQHKSLDPDKDPEFWNFAMDEMALHDLPAIIDYVLDKTNKKQVYYVGHSQAVGTLLLLCAKKPQYNDKIKLGFGMSPTAWLENSRFIVIKVEAAANEILKTANNETNIEFLPYGGFFQNAGKILCGSKASYLACSALLFSVLGFNKFQITSDVLPVLPGHLPAGTSLKDFLRWGQMVTNGFSEYDYGSKQNLELYGQEKPPTIDLSPVTMRWIFFASENDYVSDVKDVKTLVSALTRSDAKMCLLADKSFGHLDFLYADNLAKYVAPDILSTMKTGEYACNIDSLSNLL
ncbi:gastric triacylglycerol lipase-like [Galleria mellonella]|uniref:Lipase n=1 Tax=Galleria mellonella TaxID=7137 RepID=A0A6J1X9G1_GALME|nr:gastric triacylglycerol lipase-like [Galleria mellonella]XP_052750155.1 gastric triacylglycerol lipase-like [Galleria mellonella]